MVDPVYGLGAIQDPPDDRDLQIEQLYAARAIAPIVALPASLMVPVPRPPTLDQDATPQCVAYSSAWLKRYEDIRDQADFDTDEALFFQQIGGDPVYGANPRTAFDRMLHFGYPPTGHPDDADHHKIAAYYAVPVDRTAICEALYSFGPLVLSMPWYSNWFTTTVTGDLRTPSTTVAGGHAIVGIGYDEVGVWLQNSWGNGFGINGGKCRLPWAYVPRVWGIWKAVDVIEPKPAPTVVLKYGGYAGFRGTWKIITAARFRSRPSTSAPVLGIFGPTSSGLGGYLTYGSFSNAQTTDMGTLVNGSRRWLGDATGNKWVHVSLVKLVR